MGKDMIEIFNSNISEKINKYDEFYEALIGSDEFTPEPTIIESEDINCGALCNELEFARIQTTELTSYLQIATASGDELEEFINAFVDLPRRGVFELDDVYRNRFLFLVSEGTNYRRVTKYAIRDAINYFVTDINKIQVLEHFDVSNLFFEVRLEGSVSVEDTLFLDNTECGYLDNEFIGGIGIGATVTYLSDLLSRIKAGGVDFDIIVVLQDRFTITCDAVIGTLQMYKTSDGHIKTINTLTTTSDGQIV